MRRIQLTDRATFLVSTPIVQLIQLPEEKRATAEWWRSSRPRGERRKTLETCSGHGERTSGRTRRPHPRASVIGSAGSHGCSMLHAAALLRHAVRRTPPVCPRGRGAERAQTRRDAGGPWRAPEGPGLGTDPPAGAGARPPSFRTHLDTPTPPRGASSRPVRVLRPARIGFRSAPPCSTRTPAKSDPRLSPPPLCRSAPLHHTLQPWRPSRPRTRRLTSRRCVPPPLPRACAWRVGGPHPPHPRARDSWRAAHSTVPVAERPAPPRRRRLTLLRRRSRSHLAPG